MQRLLKIPREDFPYAHGEQARSAVLTKAGIMLTLQLILPKCYKSLHFVEFVHYRREKRLNFIAPHVGSVENAVFCSISAVLSVNCSVNCGNIEEAYMPNCRRPEPN